MAARKKKVIIKSSVIAKTLESSVTNLVTALGQADKSVTARSSESKKLLNETRRLRKRRLTQMGKKKRAIAAEKKNSTVDTRKAVRTVSAELVVTNKSLIKTTAGRQAVLLELSSLKDSQKKLRAYVKGIDAANRQIAKPKKKRTMRKS